MWQNGVYLLNGNGKFQGGGGSAEQVALLSVTTAPSGSFAVGSKYYNSSTKKIVTAVTSDTWTGATSADPVFNVIYTFNSGYYAWDGDTLESTDLNLYILKSSLESGVVATNLDTIVKNGFYTCYGTATGVPSVDYSWFVIHQNSNVNTASATQRAVAYYKDSMIVYERVKTSSTWGDWKTSSNNTSSIVPFSVKSSNVDSNGLTDIASISQIINVGCSVTSGVATGGSGKYLPLLETAPIASADSWEIKTKYYYNGGGGADLHVIFGYTGSLDFQTPILAVDPATADVKFLASSDGGSWGLFSTTSMALTMVAETTYYVKLSYDSVNGYKFEHSTDGVSYTTSWTDATTTKTFASVPFLFMNNGLNLATYYSAGTMDLTETVITIDSEVWWDYTGDTISFKIDDGTLYAPLTIVSADGTKTALTTVSDLDLSSFADGRINIFFGASGAVAYINTIFNQPNEPTPTATNDIWFNNLDEAKKWSGSAWETTDLVFGIYVIKNGILETYGNVPFNYNGIGERLVKSYGLTTENYSIYVRPQFRFSICQCGKYISNSDVGYLILIYPMLNTYYCPTCSGGQYIGVEIISRLSIKVNPGGTNQICYWEVKGYIA